jgi:hypothetical protein
MPKNSALHEILVVHHSHTDWGYTSHPTIVEEWHHRFIDEAVELCRANDEREPAMRYRWTCESSWIVHSYLRARTAKQRRAFLACIERGDIEVAALPLHPTPLADGKTIRAALGIVKELREAGIPISVALGCDINGLSWPWADALLEFEIPFLAMAMNFVCGGGMERWTLFNWQSANQKTILCWQGTHYNQGAYWGLNHEAYSSAQVAPPRIEELRDYPYEKLLLQVTNIPPDNMGPHPQYLDYLRRYNALAEENNWPRMRTALLSDWFDFLVPLSKDAPTFSGDWTDWWAAGLGSAPRETAALREAQRRIAVCEERGADAQKCEAIRRKIFLAAEHTWCASSSTRAPFRHSSIAGMAAQQNQVYEAAYGANEVLRQSLAPRWVMHDPNFEAFDPAWSNVAAAAPIENETTTKPLGGASRASETAPDWKKWLSANCPHIILEEPADGLRATWFEVGKFNAPESHGRWPARAQWKRETFENAETETGFEGDVARWEIKINLDFSLRPRALYIEFPFRFEPDSVLADVGGVWADPREQNVPGSCVNWWTIHSGVLMSSPRGSLLWTSWDAPLVMFDAPCPNPPKKRNSLKRPTLVSWAMNNYWFTNFPAVAGGEYVFRYRLKFWPHAASIQEAEAFCKSDPLASYPQIAAAAR